MKTKDTGGPYVMYASLSSMMFGDGDFEYRCEPVGEFLKRVEVGGIPTTRFKLIREKQ
ncbi:MAG: hypothetical protein ACRDD8_05845 [Bacteroidales bacterium]